jgi:hypothetical protein
MQAASAQHQSQIEHVSLTATRQKIDSSRSEQAATTLAGVVPIRRVPARQQLLIRENIKQDVIAHFFENKANYPKFIRNRRDLIIQKVMAGSTVEEAFAAEARRKR